MTNPTPDELRTLLVTLLAEATGSTIERWDKCLSQLKPVTITENPNSNWRTARFSRIGCDIKAAKAAVKLVQRDHPFVRW